MTVVAFQAPKDPLAFDGMGIKIDVEEQREIFDDLFTGIQTALLFCTRRQFACSGRSDARGRER